MPQFDYETAFSRNFGLLSKEEQEKLRNATVAIAGMGGVGGDYLITLARSGVGRFRLADFDKFELANFNRQYGADMTTIGQSKVDVMAAHARNINPELDLAVYPHGLTDETLEEFVAGADVIVDGIDLFEPDWHRKVINQATAAGLISLAAVPLGFGSGMLAFGPDGMSFDDYFAWDEGFSKEEKVLQLALGFAPAGYHLRYIDPASVDLKQRKGPSSVAGCKLCAAIVATQVIESVLRPQGVRTAPWFTHIDLKLGKLRQGRLRFGNRGPLQRVKKAVASKRLL